MGRPPKNVEVNNKRFTKAELETRLQAENEIKGFNDSIKPSDRLNANQKKIFKYIVENLKQAKLLGNLDTYHLEATCIAIDRLQTIEMMINQDFSKAFDKEVMNTKAKYTADFNKGVEMFALAPAARAKFGVMAANKAKEEADPLLKVLKKKSS
jgi:P27 family predicted phage terminase small subunit